MFKFRKVTVWSSCYFLIATLALIPSACTKKEPSGEDALPEIRVGVITYNAMPELDPLSLGNAADMAVSEINEEGGLDIGGRRHKVTWINRSVTAGVPEESVSAVQRLINQEKVAAIIGPLFSVDAIPAGEIAELSGIPLITPLSTNPRATLNRRFVFRAGFLDEFQGRVAAIFTKLDLNARRAAVLYNIADPYSRSLAEVFRKQMEEMNGKVAAFESYAGDRDDVTGQLLRIRKAKPDVFYLPVYSEQATRIAASARKLNIDSVFFGGDSWDRSTIREIPEFDGSYMTAHYSYKFQGERNRRFVQEYENRFSQVPTDPAALSYDAFRLIFEAIRYSKSADPASIRDGLYAMGPYHGVTGIIDYVVNGDPVKGIAVLHIRDQKIEIADFLEGE